jgi:hypothetical protein
MNGRWPLEGDIVKGEVVAAKVRIPIYDLNVERVGSA